MLFFTYIQKKLMKFCYSKLTYKINNKLYNYVTFWNFCKYNILLHLSKNNLKKLNVFYSNLNVSFLTACQQVQLLSL